MSYSVLGSRRPKSDYVYDLTQLADVAIIAKFRKLKRSAKS
jgi:hypothetical protein